MTRRVACVFGGSGFIGRHVVRRLAASGMRVRVGVRDREGAHFLKPMGDVGMVVPVRCDIGDTTQVAHAIGDAELVVNAVGTLVEHRHAGFFLSHAVGPANIADAARVAGVKSLVHISALGADKRSASLYARSKAEGEERVRHAFPDAVILRPSVVVGAEDSFFNRFAGMTAFSPFLPVVGHGKFQPVFVGDVADAVVIALDDPARAGKTYTLGGPRAYTLAELLTMMLHAMGRERRLVHVPMALATILGALPLVPLTVDQVKLLRSDNIVPPNAPGLADLGITPTSVEAVLPSILARYRNPFIHAFPA